jgi:hypothetical protein
MLLKLILFTFNVAEIKSIYLSFKLYIWNKCNDFFEIDKEKLEKTALNYPYYVG